jgi:hypothetical protein
VGSDRSPGSPRTPGPFAPPSALHLLAKDRCASTPSHEPKLTTFGLRMPIRKSRSDRVVSHHLAGLLRATAGRLVASCSRPWGSPRFTRTSRSQPRSSRRDHPSKDVPICPWYSGHPEPWPPWRSSSLTPYRPIIADDFETARCEAGTFEALSVRMVCNVVVRFRLATPYPSWASISSSRSRRPRGQTSTPVTGDGPPDAPTIVTPSKPGVDWRDAGVDGPDRRTDLRPP